MSAADLLDRLRAGGIAAELTADGRLRLSGASAALLTPALRAEVAAQRDALLALLGGARAPAEGPAQPGNAGSMTAFSGPDADRQSTADAAALKAEPSRTIARPRSPRCRPRPRAASPVIGTGPEAPRGGSEAAAATAPGEPEPATSAVEQAGDMASEGQALAWVVVGLIILVVIVAAAAYVVAAHHRVAVTPAPDPTEEKPPAANLLGNPWSYGPTGWW